MEFSTSCSLFLTVCGNFLYLIFFLYSYGASCPEDTISIFYLPEKWIVKGVKQIINCLGKSLEEGN